jgi:hypothetical protein
VLYGLASEIAELLEAKGFRAATLVLTCGWKLDEKF